jgi:hypothetical protein
LGGSLALVEEDRENEEELLIGVHIDQRNSILTCNSVNMSKLLFSIKDGGTVIGKFQRQTLALESANGTASLDR